MTKQSSLVIHGLIGWVICGATIGMSRQFLPMNAALMVHAGMAPLAFGFLTWHHFRRFPESSPITTGLTMIAIVVGLDAFVVAPFLERSYEMFRSVVGTWVPFALILASSYLVGRVARQAPRVPGNEDEHAAEHAHAPDRRR